MTRQATLTERARRDCERCGIDQDQIQDAIDDAVPNDVQNRPDPHDPATMFRYIRALFGVRTVEIACELRPDGRLLVMRVIVLSEGPSG